MNSIDGTPMPQRLSAILLLAALVAGALFASCSEGNPSSPPVNNEHDPPTTIVLRCIAVNAAGEPIDTVTALARDTTVVKGLPEYQGVLALKSGATYRCDVLLTNETMRPPEDVTEGIDRERNAHMFVWTPMNGVDTSRVVLSDFSMDGNGALYGRSCRAVVPLGPPASGTLNIVLRHYDSGVKSEPVFDTDVNRSFPLRIE
jgi:hypothetical protein